MTERDGELGDGFSVSVARAWERELFAAHLPSTRRVALRTAIVLGHRGVLGPIRRLAQLGLGGPQLDGRWPITANRRASGTAHRSGARGGRQRFSWIHIEDVARIIDFLEEASVVEGAVNASAPSPVENRDLMAAVRRELGVPFGLPAPRWMLEIGSAAIRAETELVLKSRWVLPGKLTEDGFDFHYPELAPAIQEALAR